MLLWIVLLYFAFGLSLTCYLSAREMGLSIAEAVVTIFRGAFVAPVEFLWNLWKNRKGTALLLLAFFLPTTHYPLPTASAAPCPDGRCPLMAPRKSDAFSRDLWAPATAAETPAKYSDPSVGSPSRREIRQDRRETRR